MELAVIKDLEEIMDLYSSVINEVNKSNVKLGWNISIYPDRDFVLSAIKNNEMCIKRDNRKIVAVAVVNNKMNKEYDDMPWLVKENPCTIHALATHPEYRKGSVSDAFLHEIAIFCQQHHYNSIHLDVIDTNTPAYHMYLRNGYKEISQIEMYYEVVGTRKFWMMELPL